MPNLSVTVITGNEAADIDRALQSVAWADELIVVDSMSTDDTVAIARQHTDRVIVREWPGYAAQKNYAASIARHDWILSLDADERVTPELTREIQDVLADAPPHAACRLWLRRPNRIEHGHDQRGVDRLNGQIADQLAIVEASGLPFWADAQKCHSELVRVF